MGGDTEQLLERALTARDRAARRGAFVQLVRSDDWRQVLAPHVLSCQGYDFLDTLYPDWATLEAAAVHIADNEDKIQRCLELVGCRFSGELLLALARQMQGGLVEHALAHLRTADGARAALLQFVLQEADPEWVKRPKARPVIRRQLRQISGVRANLIFWLARADNIEPFIDVLEQNPPVSSEDWNALGLGAVRSEKLQTLALATLPHHPAPLLYLLRLEPVDELVKARMMACARADWIAAALECAVLDGLNHPALVPLAETGVRLGGRPLAAASAWIGTTKLSRTLLARLGGEMDQARADGGREFFCIRTNAPSADRALEHGRSGKVPLALDAAALVRQLRGEKVLELVREILEHPRENMIEAVLHPLCAVNQEAAREVVILCNSINPAVKRRAAAACAWVDVLWPEVADNMET